MDPSVLYMSAFIFCLLLSWYLYKRFFADSGLQDKFCEFVNSGGKFVFGFISLLIISAVIFSINHFLWGFIISTASIVGSYSFVIIGSILFRFGFAKMNERQLMRNIPRSKIRSVAVGAVEISGSIVSKDVVTTLYSKSPCVYYRSELEIYSGGEGSDGGWNEIPGPAFKIPFGSKTKQAKLWLIRKELNSRFQIESLEC